MSRTLKIALLRVLKVLGVFALSARLTRGRLRILCYHSFALADEAEFRPKLYVHPDQLRDRIATLRRYGASVLPLGEAVERLYAGTLPALPVAITIDDGWAPTVSTALPMLAREGMPATVYIASYYAWKQTPVFSMLVQYAFWKSEVRTLELRGCPWIADGTYDLEDPRVEDVVIDAAIEYGNGLDSEDERQAFAHRIAQLLGTDIAEVVRSRRLSLMSPEEIRAATEAGVDIQLHTHRHRFPADDEACARAEIRDNRDRLTSVVGAPLLHFCYPSGIWSTRTFGLLRELGIVSATTCEPGLNDAQTHRYALRRFLDGSHLHALEFEAQISGCAELLRAARRLMRRPSAP